MRRFRDILKGYPGGYAALAAKLGCSYDRVYRIAAGRTAEEPEELGRLYELLSEASAAGFLRGRLPGWRAFQNKWVREWTTAGT